MNIKIALQIFVLLATLNFGLAYGQSGLANPECVIPYLENYLVSNIGQEINTKLDGDGFIALVDAKGNVIKENYFQFSNVKLNAPKGMAIINETLYVSDIQRIIGYDLNNIKEPIIIDLTAEAIFLNDIIAQNEHTILVTDTFKNVVFKINLITKEFKIIQKDLEGSNGIAFSNDGFYIATTGQNFNGKGTIYNINSNGESKILKSCPVGILDGVQKISDHKLLITDWGDLKGGQGHIYLYDIANQTFETSSIDIMSPADFFYNEKNNKVFIPQTLKNKILVYNLEELFPNSKETNLFHYGFIDSFLGGMYEGGYTYRNLLNQGNFGLGAPDKLDGEITILNGIAYQTKASGITVVPNNSEKASYAFITDFSKDFDFTLNAISSKENLEKKLDEQLSNANAMYAIKIEGTFKLLKSRAFPPVKNKPYPELASMLANQAFFKYENIEGTLVGFRLPQFLKGVNVPGYHFHFISKDKSKGGHLLEVAIETVTIEVDSIDNYSVKIPNLKEFEKFDFNKDRSLDVEKAESGKNE